MTIVAIVPAKDREDSIARTVAALAAVDDVDRVLVVDDGSTDATTERAREAGAQVLRLAVNRGKAGAVAAGVAATPDADVYLLIDADVADDAGLAPALLAPVVADEADLTIGVLPAAGKRGGFGMVRRFARWGVRRGCGFDGVAPLSGQRAVRAGLLRGMDGVARFGLEVAMTIDASRAGARIVEVEVPMEHRHTGRTVSGFRHRGAQGRDVAEALWPRLVPTRLRRVLLAALVVVIVGLSFVTSRAMTVASVPATGPARHVVIIGVPHLGLDDIGTAAMPATDRLMAEGALGMMTVRTKGGTRSGAAYATLGASAQVNASSGAGQVADRDEPVEGSPAIDVLERRTGHRPAGSVLVPQMPTVRRIAGSYTNSKPGALGDALHGAGMQTAVIANSDYVDDTDQRIRNAPAALAVASSAGAVDHGTVTESLTRHDPSKPYGMTADQRAVVQAFDAAVGRSAVVVVDPGETDRASAYAPGMVASAADALRTEALRSTDRIIGAISTRLPADTLLVVAGMSPPGSKAELVPVVLWGAGVVPGGLESPSTGRPGLVTLTDLAPTVLESLGVPVPPDMVGQAIRYSAHPADLGALRQANQRVIDRDKAYSPFLHSFVNLQVVLYLLALIALVRADTPAILRRLLRFVFVGVLIVPFMTFILRLIPPLGSLGVGSVVLLYALSALAAWWLHDRGSTPWGPLVAVAVANLVLLGVDLALGARLQESSLLGYSPTAAARFGGIGNAAYGVLAASVIIVMAWIVGRSVRPRDAWWGAVAVGVLVVVVDGAPWLGSDVGGILSLIPAIGIMAVLLSGRRLTWKSVAIPVLVAVVGLGAVVAYEALQPATGRDHIGRFFLGGSEGGAFWSTIARKISTNVGLLSSSVWSRLLPVVGVFVALVYLFARCWARILPRGSAQRHTLIGLFVVAALGYALNDSGAMAAAIIFVYLGAHVALPALADPTGPDELLEPTSRTEPEEVH